MTPGAVPDTAGRSMVRRLEGRPAAAATFGVERWFGEEVALRGLDLTVPERAVYLLVGHNGSGKSTTFRMLLDILRPDRGRAEVLRMDTRSGPQVRARMGWVPEGHVLPYPWLRVERMVRAHASYYPSWDEEYAARLRSALGIEGRRRCGALSKGQARRVQILLALAHRPQVLLLDEPTDGLDPAARETVLALLAEHLTESPTTMIVSTQLVNEMERLADHLGVLRDGELIVQLPRADLDRYLRSYAVEVPAAWSGFVPEGLSVVRSNGRQRERELLVWGDEREVVERLGAAGATVRDVAPVPLHDATVALMGGTAGP